MEKITNLRVIEFFSGIGGWRAALSKSTNEYTIVGAFDINPLANIVYSHNYSSNPSNKSIENISSSNLEQLNSNMWLMSPPCQPFTRNNTTESRDINDPRSKAFLHLIMLLNQLCNPPKYIALENVVGFENSECCLKFLQVLSELGYEYRQFILTPNQYGVPNSRPRYYLTAIHTQSTIPYPLIPSTTNDNITQNKLLLKINEVWKSMNSSIIYSFIPNSSNIELHLEEITPCQPLANFLVYNNDNNNQDNNQDMSNYIVPDSVLMKSSSWCFDIVKPTDTNSSCFTKGYSRYIKGTGSILLFKDSDTSNNNNNNNNNNSNDNNNNNTLLSNTTTTITPITSSLKNNTFENNNSEEKDSNIISTVEEPEIKKQKLDSKDSEIILENQTDYSLEDLKGKLRYFTPEELLNLFGFNNVQSNINLFFPNNEKLTLKKKYELIGNSLNVIVASKLIDFILINSSIDDSNK